MHRRKQPPQPLKTMNDQELTFDQLQSIAGGPAFVKLGDIKVGMRSIVHPEFLPQSNRGIRGEKDQPLMPNERISISPVPTPIL